MQGEGNQHNYYILLKFAHVACKGNSIHFVSKSITNETVAFNYVNEGDENILSMRYKVNISISLSKVTKWFYQTQTYVMFDFGDKIKIRDCEKLFFHHSKN